MVVKRISCTIDSKDYEWCKDHDIRISTILGKVIKDRRERFEKMKAYYKLHSGEIAEYRKKYRKSNNDKVKKRD